MKILKILKNTILNGNPLRAGEEIKVEYLSNRDLKVLISTRKAEFVECENKSDSLKYEVADVTPKRVEVADAVPGRRKKQNKK